jgi:mRNA interferase RelE/StbE
VASYRIELKRSAAKEIEAIGSKKDRQRIVERIEKLTEDPKPSGSQKLAGEESYRVRQGNYRIIYTIEDDVLVVTVVKVGHRKKVYRK